MRQETIPPALAFLRTSIISAIILLAAASATARINAHRLSHATSHFPLSRQQKKRIITLRRRETADGARLTFISDSPLDDYSSYLEGGRFFIRIPQAILMSAQNNPEGRGFTDMRVKQGDDDVVGLSFRLQVGATVAINQNFNRLEILFFTNERANKSSPRSDGSSKHQSNGNRQD